MEVLDEDAQRVLLLDPGVSVEDGKQRFRHSVLGRWCSVMGWSGQVSRAGRVQKENKHCFYVLVCGECGVLFRWGGESTGVLVLGRGKIDDQILPGRSIIQ